MMAEGEDMDWELCKENIQPLRRGRTMSALREALSQQEDGDSAVVNQQRQAFESELRIYDGDDPLCVWVRYIKWSEEAFPQGGKGRNLSALLERAVGKFKEEKKYYNDPRYIDLWIKFAANVQEPLDIYRYMTAQGIGDKVSSFYIAWSEAYEDLGNYREADHVYEEGFKHLAEPKDKLLNFHQALQARASRQALKKITEGISDEEPERMSLANLKFKGSKTSVAPIKRTGDAIKFVSGGLPSHAVPLHASNRKLLIFDDKAQSTESKLEAWGAPPPTKMKENEKKIEKWCDVKLRQKSKYRHTSVAPPPPKCTFEPFVEESNQPSKISPCKVFNPSVNTVLSTLKQTKETPLKRLQDHQQRGETEAGMPPEQSMYCKELLLSGVAEFCFEELRAERYFKKMAQNIRTSTAQSSVSPEN